MFSASKLLQVPPSVNYVKFGNLGITERLTIVDELYVFKVVTVDVTLPMHHPLHATNPELTQIYPGTLACCS